MTELNPYESPQLPSHQMVPMSGTKKAVGFMIILILNPIAVVIAACCSCLASIHVIDANGQKILRLREVSLAPPITVFIIMGILCAAAYYRQRRAKAVNKDP